MYMKKLSNRYTEPLPAVYILKFTIRKKMVLSIGADDGNLMYRFASFDIPREF